MKAVVSDEAVPDEAVPAEDVGTVGSMATVPKAADLEQSMGRTSERSGVPSYACFGVDGWEHGRIEVTFAFASCENYFTAARYDRDRRKL